jgi:ADP-ribosylglycohydrolase
MNRRLFLKTTSLIACSTPLFHHAFAAETISADLRDRVHGVLLGSMIGDALGGPIEFQEPSAVQKLNNPPKIWGSDEVIDDASLKAAAARLELKSYEALRPRPEPYAHWTVNAEPGSVTDDSRHKLILLQALHDADAETSWPLTVEGFARAHLEWPKSPDLQDNADFKQLRADWLREWGQGARWVLGNRDPEIALPPTRMWGGLPTCSGQMSLLPLAALFPGQPGPAYRAAYQLGFFDNGFGKDLNAALVAGLAVALVMPSSKAPDPGAWKTIIKRCGRPIPISTGMFRG